MSIVNQLRSFFSGRECISLALALMIYGDFIMKLLTNADAEHLNRNALFVWLEGEDKKCCRKFRAKWFPIKKSDRLRFMSGQLRRLLRLFALMLFYFLHAELIYAFFCRTCFTLCVCPITNQFCYWHDGILKQSMWKLLCSWSVSWLGSIKNSFRQFCRTLITLWIN